MSPRVSSYRTTALWTANLSSSFGLRVSDRGRHRGGTHGARITSETPTVLISLCQAGEPPHFMVVARTRNSEEHSSPDAGLRSAQKKNLLEPAARPCAQRQMNGPSVDGPYGTGLGVPYCFFVSPDLAPCLGLSAGLT